MPTAAKRDLPLIIAAGFVRAMTVGFIGVVLAVLLYRNGLNSIQIGFVIGAGLAGAAVATSLSARYVDRWGRRRSLALLSALAAVNVTTGNDENHDGLALDRPAGLPRNMMHGPSFIGLDVNLSHDFPLTKDGAKGSLLSLGLNSFNVLNHPNDTTYVGVVGSPFFGHAVEAESPRRMQLQAEIRF